MSTAARWDLEVIRRSHAIEQVVAASGVVLRRQGSGFIGCCPFHEDSRPSLSVGGIADRFHCFGCGAHGDVIAFVQQLHGLTFVQAVERLEGQSPMRPTAATAHQAASGSTRPAFATGTGRAHEVNRMAWEYFTTPARETRATDYLGARGIDVRGLTRQAGEPVVGHTGNRWTGLTTFLIARGVSFTELEEMDLSRPTRSGGRVDTYRDRLVVPVRSREGHIDGFIGRDTTGRADSPKYINPRRTPVFDKGTALYTPRSGQLSPEATVVIVEGPLDALAVASAAATRHAQMFAPCTANGVTVSASQAKAVVSLRPSPPVIALDGDRAGREGTDRWLKALCLDAGRPAMTVRLPDGVDPADWLSERGTAGLAAFEPRSEGRIDPREVGPRVPTRDLVRILLDDDQRAPREALKILAAIAKDLTGHDLHDFVAQSSHEMTVRGWNREGTFGPALEGFISGSRVHGQAWGLAAVADMRRPQLSPDL